MRQRENDARRVTPPNNGVRGDSLLGETGPDRFHMSFCLADYPTNQRTNDRDNLHKGDGCPKRLCHLAGIPEGNAVTPGLV